MYCIFLHSFKFDLTWVVNSFYFFWTVVRFQPWQRLRSPLWSSTKSNLPFLYSSSVLCIPDQTSPRQLSPVCGIDPCCRWGATWAHTQARQLALKTKRWTNPCTRGRLISVCVSLLLVQVSGVRGAKLTSKFQRHECGRCGASDQLMTPLRTRHASILMHRPGECKHCGASLGRCAALFEDGNKVVPFCLEMSPMSGCVPVDTARPGREKTKRRCRPGFYLQFRQGFDPWPWLLSAFEHILPTLPKASINGQ